MPTLPPRPVRLPSLAALLLLAACGDGPAPVPAVTVQDSAGAALVRTPGAPTARLDLAGASATIGGRPGDASDDLYDVQSGVLLGESGFALALSGLREIRLYAPDGAPRSTLGGRGREPGRFESLGWIARAPDGGLVAWDDALLRLTRFGPDGGVRDTVTITGPDTSRALRALALLADGSALAVETPLVTRATATGVHRDSLTLYRRAGTEVRAVARAGGDEIYVRVLPTGLLVLYRPFGLATHAAPAGSGFVMGDVRDWTIERRDSAGAVRARWQRAGARRAVTDADRAAELRREAGRASNTARREQLEALWRTLPFPDSLPAYTGLQSDALGHVWPAEPDSAGFSAWSEFDAEGRWRRRVVLPRSARLLDADATRLLVRWFDADGVELAAVLPRPR